MNEASIVLGQVIIMFLLMLVGYILKKTKLLDDYGTGQLNNLVVYVVSPCLLILSFNTAFTKEKGLELLLTAVLSTCIMLIATVISLIAFKKKEEIERFGVIFNNVGFMGIPVVQAVAGDDGVFYISIMIAIWNLFVWTIGVKIMEGPGGHFSLKKAFLNPAVISVGIGLLLFFTPFKLPSLLERTMDYLGSMNTPCGMLIVGSYLANASLLGIFTSKKSWLVALCRLGLSPLFTMLFLLLVPNKFYAIKITMLIASSTPTGGLLSVFAAMFKRDTLYGARVTSLSTLLSIFTMPCMLLLGSLLWNWI